MSINRLIVIALFVITSASGFLTSCKKDISSSTISISGRSKDSPVPPSLFNWETATYLPFSVANLIPAPWIGVVGGVDGNIISDIKSSDGWSMIYSTFSNTSTFQQQGGLYFALYNKYRGLLRFYLYIPNGTAAPTSNIVHGLNLYPQGSTSSSILNFAGTDIVDLSSNQTAISKTNSQQINLLGNWIACQYEIAYDPNISQLSFPNLALQWTSQAVNVSTIQLNGTQTGVLSGSITTPSSGFPLLSTLTNLGVGALEVYGISDVAALQKVATSGSTEANFLSGLSGAISNGLGNTITNLFSGIFGGNSNNTQEVNLTMNTQIAINGTSTNSFGIASPFFVIPGEANQTNANGLIPNYTSPLGVFNLKGIPTVKYDQFRYNDRGPRLTTNFTPIDNSSLVIFNPAVNAPGVATCKLINQEVLVSTNAQQYMYWNGGHTENIAGTTYYVNPTSLDSGPGGYLITKVLVRFTIQVSPANGAPSVLIGKSFIANVIH